MMRTNMKIDVYRVTKSIEVNSTAINQVGDILIVDEDGYDGANVDNLTQGWGFKCFGSYDSVKSLGYVTMTWDEYMALAHGDLQTRENFINQYKEPEKPTIYLDNITFPVNKTEAICHPDKDGVYHCSTCLQDCPLNSEED